MKPYTMSFCLVGLLLSTLSLSACSTNSANGASTGVTGSAGGSGPNGGSIAMPREGKEMTADFLKTYVGRFVDSSTGESLTFGADNSYSTTLNRQVGRDSDPQVPYPTLCNYKMTGQLAEVVSRSAAARHQYMIYADTVFATKISNIELLPSASNSVHCADFIAQQQKAIDAAGGSLSDTTYAELLSAEQIRLHTSGGGDYVDGSPRTPSTLDEVHVRVAPDKK